MTTPNVQGWMPGVTRQVSPNFASGRSGQAVEAAVIHIMQGSYAGSIEWLTSRKSGTSSHFAVSKKGDITQMVSIFDTAYANGLSWSPTLKRWIDPEDNVVTPPWPRLRPPVNPNAQTVSIEHEGNSGDTWAPEEYDADRRILLYVASQAPLIYVPGDTLIGHCDISPTARAHCPGTGVDLAHLADLVHAVPTAAGGLTFAAPPRISAATFADVLERYSSPCAPIAAECYDIVVKASLDPAVALAFFGHESTFGTRGVSVDTKNWGNVRSPFLAERSTGQHPRNFAIYPNWQIGLVDWCDRINVRYIQERGLDTVEKAIPVYAPSSDGNVPDAYINHVRKLVADWMDEEQPAQALTWYRVANAAGANVRQGPGRQYPIVRTLEPGEIFGSDGTIQGEAIGGNVWWSHHADETGFISMTLLVPA